MSDKEWVNFFHPDGRILCSYTVEGTFAFECQATKRQLAYEYGIKEHEIKVTLTKRPPKANEWDGKTKARENNDKSADQGEAGAGNDRGPSDSKP